MLSSWIGQSNFRLLEELERFLESVASNFDCCWLVPACSFLWMGGGYCCSSLTRLWMNQIPLKKSTLQRHLTCKSQPHVGKSPSTQVHCPGRTAQDWAPFLWFLVLWALYPKVHSHAREAKEEIGGGVRRVWCSEPELTLELVLVCLSTVFFVLHACLSQSFLYKRQRYGALRIQITGEAVKKLR